MSDPSIYDSPPPSANAPRGWLVVDVLAAVIWLAIPAGLLFARQQLLPLFAEFDTELPSLSHLLLQPSCLLVLSMISLAVVFTIFVLPRGAARLIYTILLIFAGLLVGLVCAAIVMVPLLSLLQGLA